jgi:cytochrome c-type biogenesis protein CcmE
MTKLDDELAKAVAASEADAPVQAPVSRDAPEDKKPRRNLGLLAALFVMGGGTLALVMTSFEGAAVYSKGVDELVAEREKLADRTVRVEGTLVKGSLVRRDQPCEYRFRMTKNGKELSVQYPQCVVPDTFRDVPNVDVSVTAEGKLDEAGNLQAHNIFAKCPSKYEMQQSAAKGEKAPHGAIPPQTAPVPVKGLSGS